MPLQEGYHCVCRQRTSLLGDGTLPRVTELNKLQFPHYLVGSLRNKSVRPLPGPWPHRGCTGVYACVVEPLTSHHMRHVRRTVGVRASSLQRLPDHQWDARDETSHQREFKYPAPATPLARATCPLLTLKFPLLLSGCGLLFMHLHH